MIINRNPQPESSFLSMEKDLGLISNMILRNPRLKKLLFYTTPDCLDKPAVSEEDGYSLLYCCKSDFF